MSELDALPERFYAGTTILWRISLSDYPADQGWTATLYLRGPGVVTQAAAASGSDHLLTLAATATASQPSGTYRWFLQVEKAGEKFIPDGYEGEVFLEPNLATATAGQLQDQDEKDLAALRALREGRTKPDIEAYEIMGRSIKLIPLKERLELEHLLERRIAMKRRGTGPINDEILVTFGDGEP
jgi:hypothetical protein